MFFVIFMKKCNFINRIAFIENMIFTEMTAASHLCAIEYSRNARRLYYELNGIFPVDRTLA